MSYNGSGTFNINSAGQPVVTGTVISSTAFNALTADLGTGLSTALTKDGQTVATARIPFAAGINSSLVTDATNTTTGSIITAGGVGIAKAVFVGTTLNVAGASTLAGITGSFNGTVGATTPAAGSFTTVSASGAATMAAINASGTVAMAGAATVGTTLGVTGTLAVTGNVTAGGNAVASINMTLNGTDGTNSTFTLSSAGTAKWNQYRQATTNNWRLDSVTVNTIDITQAGAVTIPGTLAVTGTLSATGNTTVGFTGGTALLTGVATSNGFISHFMQNDSTGNAAVTRFSLGNNTSTGAAQFLVYGGNHATLPNVVDLNNANNAALRLLANNAVVAQVNPTGLAVTGTLSATGNVVGGNYSTSLQALSAWTANTRATQLTTYGAVASNNSIGNVGLSCNAYESTDSNWKRVAATSAGLYQISYTGAHTWYSTGASSADSAISWTTQMALNASGIVTMSAYGAGTATFSAAGVISSVSDETWKIKDGVPVDPDSMLNKLEPGYWYYNDEKKETFGKDRQLGFYAQNVNAAIGPEAAPEPEEGKPWGYYDRSVLAVTVMSLKKALETIESLTARITALEAK